MTDVDASEVLEAADSTGRGIFDGFSGFVTPTPDDWKRVLSNGTVVVDTNVLLNLYRYNNAAREAFLSTLAKMGTRLWVPNQVMAEFWRNRERALEDPAKQLESSKKALLADLSKAVEKLRAWANRVSLDRAELRRLEGNLSQGFDQVIESMEKVVDSSGLGMERDTSKDRVISELAILLAGKVGLPLVRADYDAAIIEGKRRVEKKIPPGYMDKDKDSRGDDSEAGDFLVWSQIKLEAKRRGGDFLFVTGDSKEDWWWIRQGAPVGPRNELAEELRDETSAHLYMLKPERLLVLARDYLAVPVTEDSVQNVEMVDARSEAEERVSNWNYVFLGQLLRALRAQAPVQESAIRRAVRNGGFVSRDEVYEIGGYEPGRMLKGFTRPVSRISQDVSFDANLSGFDQDVLVPVYDEMKAGFGRVDGFSVHESLHGPLEKAWEILDRED
ncbi:PIN-like domain-containing protein [Streptomyces nojiriensis]|uniref:PIN-like domain-containing protein n=1 Tax=Streptomyces nojiriensis TaxID=66374 RepID=UPI00167A65A5|nr:PIN domain-containing protein [Streptomyces nojiriensis]